MTRSPSRHAARHLLAAVVAMAVTVVAQRTVAQSIELSTPTSRPAFALPADPIVTQPPPPPADPALRPLQAMALDVRRAPEARAALARFIADHPRSGYAELLLAISYHQEGRYGPARPHFERAITLEPRLAAAYHFYGYCLYYLGELDQARRSFEIHLCFAPEEGNSHFGIGLTDLDADRLDEAERRFRLAIKYQRNNPRRIKDVASARTRLSDVHVRRGNLDEARAELEIATQIYPDLYGAHLKMYRVLLRLGEDDAATAAYADYEAALRRVRPELAPASSTPASPAGV